MKLKLQIEVEENQKLHSSVDALKAAVEQLKTINQTDMACTIPMNETQINKRAIVYTS